MIQETPIQETAVFPLPNPWKAMWVHPRATIRGIIERDSEHQLEVIATLLGISFFWWRASDILQFNLWGLVNALVVLVLGALIGTVYVLISGVVFTLVGRLVGGVGTIGDGCAAIAWSAIPQIFTIPIPYVYTLLHRPPFADVYELRWLMIWVGEPVLLGLMAGLNLWGILLIMATFAEVHQFSIWKTVGIAIILSIPLGYVCFWCAMILVVVFSPAV